MRSVWENDRSRSDIERIYGPRSCIQGPHSRACIPCTSMGTRAEFKVWHSRSCTEKAYSWQNEVVVASMDTAKRDPHKDILLSTDYDMIIIDEAHKLKNKNDQLSIHAETAKKYCLLLTATPVQNDMSELFNLINLLKPGQLGRQGDFSANFVVDKRIPKTRNSLRTNCPKS